MNTPVEREGGGGGRYTRRMKRNISDDVSDAEKQLFFFFFIDGTPRDVEGESLKYCFHIFLTSLPALTV